MNDYNLHYYGLRALTLGMNAAADRFAKRMDEINANRREMKLSNYYLNYTMTLARQVDDLHEVLWNHADRVKALENKFNALTQEIKDLKKEKNEYMNYVGEVWMAFDKIENDFQEASCARLAIRETFFEFLKNYKENNDQNQDFDKFLEEVNLTISNHYTKSMNENNFKKGMPATRISSFCMIKDHVIKLQKLQKDQNKI
ncbi:MAG: hypothetical protein EOP12_02375 [Pseudomonas sp.]|nr:MAG: hypothetical protein EOP12_02375 [Pseudomonas sp.]